MPQNAIVTIPKESLSQLPTAQFDGEICIVDKPELIDEAIKELRNESILGFDTETRPSFKKGHLNKVALIQLSSHKKCFLFRINHIGLVKPLIDLLEDESILKIGLSTHDDFHNLNKLQTIEPKGFIELQNYVKEFRIADNSLARIYGILFKKRVSKGQRLTNWEAENLTPAQQNYAALDAIACIHIYEYLAAGNFLPEESEFLTIPSEIENKE
ncbi:MAG: 3'-5' exonuclease domain-containing protein 2 [Muribaculaceae bacterium]|nr:3'-5' exonuclease domain-containing protein 2 [Muribaculaceae bacterium]MDE6754614.1 3'-5' exonuclease domain-containing protein 2 [Muribaculaceae bacterium]